MLRSQLRQDTRSEHDALDSLIGDLNDLPSYSRYVLGMTVFRRVVEAALEKVHWPLMLGDWRPMLITEPLKNDCADLGLSAPRANIQSLDLIDPSDVIGLCYVIEGSSNGARLLLSRARALGLREDFGARHLCVQANNRENWRRYVALLDRIHKLEAVDPLRAVSFARMTFAAAAVAMKEAQNAD